MESLWFDLHPHLAGADVVLPARAETVVVGAGLTGLAVAVLLARSGQEVVLLEDRHVGAVTTGHTTAKLSLLQGSQFSEIRKRNSDEVLAAYLEANREGQAWLRRFMDDRGIEYQVRDAYTYAMTDDGLAELEAERDACRAVGLDASETTETDLPFAVKGALKLPDQVQIDPLAVLQALREEFEHHGGQLVEGCRVTDVSSSDPVEVAVERSRGPSWAVGSFVARRAPQEPRVEDAARRAPQEPRVEDAPQEPRVEGAAQEAGDNGTITADRVILATGTPILDRGGHFAKLVPSRSYVTMFRVPGAIPQGMYLSIDGPTRSLRTVPTPDGELLMVGGNGHVTGRSESEAGAVEGLVEWAKEHFPGAELTHSWSAQDYQPHDRLPFAGPLPGGGGAIYAATGYSKWGMANAIAAALNLSQQILGGSMGWADVLNGRSTSVRSVLSGLKENAEVAGEMVKDWVSAELRSLPDEAPAEGQGVVGREGGKPVAVSTVDGVTCKVSGICTHLGGVLAWNDEARSWDCPLHGSRFGADGARLEGPAVADLERLS